MESAKRCSDDKTPFLTQSVTRRAGLHSLDGSLVSSLANSLSRTCAYSMCTLADTYALIRVPNSNSSTPYKVQTEIHVQVINSATHLSRTRLTHIF